MAGGEAALAAVDDTKSRTEAIAAPLVLISCPQEARDIIAFLPPVSYYFLLPFS
jgi:hypothetical protein